MIKWQLSEIIAKRGISGKELAEQINVHANTVSRLRNSDNMPPIDGDLLDNLCKSLNCFPIDLIKFIPPGQQEDISTSKMQSKSRSARLQRLTLEITEAIETVLEVPFEKTKNLILEIFTILNENMD